MAVLTETDDLTRVREVLVEVEQKARDLRWANERPWRTESHVWDDDGMITIDLHDLNAALTKSIIAVITELATDLKSGGIILVTGQGRHSVGLPVLRQVVVGSLVRLERSHGWRQRDIGPGRVLLVVNEDRVPARYREGTPLWVVAFFVVFLLALGWALPPSVGVPLVLVALWFGWAIRRADRRESSPTVSLEE